MKAFSAILAALLSLTCTATAYADAGPPLMTDDPDTPGNNAWEINVAVLSQFNNEQSHLQAPLADLNYGVGEHIELTYELPWAIASEGGSSQTGLDQSVAGVKWRFCDQESHGVAISMYPQYSFKSPAADIKPLPDQSANMNQLLLPIEIEESVGRLSLDQELGYSAVMGDTNQIVYGVAASYPLERHLSLLGELHGDMETDLRGDELYLNFGSVIGIRDSLNVLVSMGRSFRTIDSNPVTYVSYAGLQFLVN